MDDADAHLFLCRQAGGALANGQPMPRVLEAYACETFFLMSSTRVSAGEDDLSSG